jgi:putative spermidine/putrescine transport system permease protein
VLAFGFILVFSSDTLPWLGSVWLLVAGHAVLCVPYYLQAVVTDMQRLGLATLEDAADSLGSRPSSASSTSCSPRCVTRSSPG